MKELLRMQKLAGLITESELKKYLAEGKLYEEDFKNPILDKYLELKKSIDYKTVFPTDLQSFVDSLDNTEREGLKRDLAEGKLLKENTNPIWVIDSFEDSADIEQAGPEYKTAVINIIKSKHPDISDKDLEASIEVMNVTWYNEARSNAKGSDPEEMEVSAEDFADGAIEHYEDVIVWDNNR